MKKYRELININGVVYFYRKKRNFVKLDNAEKINVNWDDIPNIEHISIGYGIYGMKYTLYPFGDKFVVVNGKGIPEKIGVQHTKEFNGILYYNSCYHIGEYYRIINTLCYYADINTFIDVVTNKSIKVGMHKQHISKDEVKILLNQAKKVVVSNISTLTNNLKNLDNFLEKI